ncbi:hypothetical protein TR66_33405 [Streptomyces sp. WM6391]|nr:hypothetical protein TR66_33405 [Streptomyces sp. WM6391]
MRPGLVGCGSCVRRTYPASRSRANDSYTAFLPTSSRAFLAERMPRSWSCFQTLSGVDSMEEAKLNMTCSSTT